MQCTDKLAVNTTRKDFTPHSGTEDMLINMRDGKLVNEAKSDECLSSTLLSESSIGNQCYLGGAKESSEPQSTCDTTTETEVRSLTKNTVLESYVYLIIGQYIWNLYVSNNGASKSNRMTAN
jgi:hypothetical protein